MYPESGLDNVQLFNVPIWRCKNNHEEVVIPAEGELLELLAHMIIRKPAALIGPEVKFLRRRLRFTAKDFAGKMRMTPVRLSQLETSKNPLPKRVELLFRLLFAALIAERDNKPFPNDLAKYVDQFKEAWNIGAHRIKHDPNAPPEKVWQEAA